MKAVILFSHGSTLCGAGTALDRHAERLRDRYGLVEVGYLNYSSPTFEESVQKVLVAGADEIIVVPYFLVPGYFVTKSLPARVAESRMLHPGVKFEITESLGTDPLLAEAVIESALDPLPQSDWREALSVAARLCRFSSSCPIHGTPACPPTYIELEPVLNG
jgi:sirohydrochlorin ferrochelatase